MSYQELLPSGPEYKKYKKRFSSFEAFKKWYEKKAPKVETARKQMERNSALADIAIALEMEPKLQEELKKSIEEDIQSLGLEGVCDTDQVSNEALRAIQEGEYSIAIDAHPDTQEDQMVLLPNGNIQEKLPVQFALSEQYAVSLQGSQSL